MQIYEMPFLCEIIQFGNEFEVDPINSLPCWKSFKIKKRLYILDLPGNNQWQIYYCKVSNIRRTLLGNKLSITQM